VAAKKKGRGAPRTIHHARRKKIVRLAKDGKSLAAIGRELGHDRKTIRAILAEAGVEAPSQKAAAEGPKKAEPAPRPEYRQEYAELGAPPKDPLEAQVWAHEVLALSAYQIMVDEKYEGHEPQRRKELRETIAGMQKLIPRTRLFKAEQLVRGDASKVDEDPGPNYDDAPPFSGPTYRAAPERGDG